MQNRLEEAYSYFLRAVELAPTNSNAQLHLAMELARRGKSAEAAAHYRLAVKYGHDLVMGMNNLAWLLALDGKADESLEILETAIRQRGELAELLDTRAVAYLMKGRHALAVADMQDAIAEAPTDHRYFHLAQAHLRAGNAGAASAALIKAKELGLTEFSVDPLERPAYHQLLAKLDQR